ncbi:MAG: hypothetical protein WA366_12810, partial [Pseudolabrys sp.]
RDGAAPSCRDHSPPRFLRIQETLTFSFRFNTLTFRLSRCGELGFWAKSLSINHQPSAVRPAEMDFLEHRATKAPILARHCWPKMTPAGPYTVASATVYKTDLNVFY